MYDTINLKESIRDDFEIAVKKGEVVFQDEVTEDRWEWLLQKALDNPDYYIEGAGFIQIIPSADDFTGVTNEDR